MAKSDKKDVYNTAMGKIPQAEAEYNPQIATSTDRSQTTWDRATQDYDKAYGGYSDYAAGGGLKPEDIDRMRAAWGKVGSSGGGGYGGFAAPTLGTSAYQNLSSAFANAYRPDFGQTDAGFTKLADQGGGFDADQLKQIYGNIGQLSDIGKTGGITDEDKSGIIRKQMLDQEVTGGYSDQDKALVRAKSAASSPAYFAALKDNLERQRSASGNLANASAVDFKTARQGSQQQAQDRLAQEMALQESVRKGKETAGQFLSNQQMGLAGLRTANQLTGARAAAETGTGTQAAITANQQRALQGLQTSQSELGQWGLGQAGGLDQFGLTRAGGLDQHDIAQAQMELQARAANAAGSAQSGYASARDQAEYEQWVTTYGNTQKQYGIEGLSGLYGTNLGASEIFGNQALQGLGGKYGAQGQMLGIASQNRGNTAMENAGIIGGIAAPVIGNYLANKYGPNKSNPSGGATTQGGGGGYQYPGQLGGVNFGGNTGGTFGGDNSGGGGLYPSTGAGPGYGFGGGGYPGSGGGLAGGPTTGGGQFTGAMGGLHYDYATGRWVRG